MKKSFIIIILFLYSSLLAQRYSDVAISGPRGLTFPSLLPGISSTILTTSSSAGRYLITMNKNMTLAVTFTLPSNLTFSGNNLPITFTATKSQSSSDATMGTEFDPYIGTTVQRVSSSTNKWYIRLGGTIPTPSTQAAGGPYQGTVIMTITITGA